MKRGRSVDTATFEEMVLREEAEKKDEEEDELGVKVVVVAEKTKRRPGRPRKNGVEKPEGEGKRESRPEEQSSSSDKSGPVAGRGRGRPRKQQDEPSGSANEADMGSAFMRKLGKVPKFKNNDVAEEILGVRWSERKLGREYLVRFKGYEEPVWKNAQLIRTECGADLIADYYEKYTYIGAKGKIFE